MWPTSCRKFVGHTQQRTDHLNSTDTTGSIKFTHEEETGHSMSFLDLNIHHTDGDIKIKIHRKPSHTDQYLLWTSQHPTIHKLSVDRTLFERATIVTDPEDRTQEKKHIKHALMAGQYLQWAIKKGAEQVKNKNNPTQGRKGKKTNKNTEELSPCCTLEGSQHSIGSWFIPKTKYIHEERYQENRTQEGM